VETNRRRNRGDAKNGTPVRFRVKLNGVAPGDDHGSDSSADGLARFARRGCISSSARRAIKDVTFEIAFLEPGVEASSFTFG
jgi:hypothetical protein